jgi:hypothetical protein
MTLNLPAGHSEHVTVPVVLEKVPDGQRLHFVEPGELNVPFGQGVQF